MTRPGTITFEIVMGDRRSKALPGRPFPTFTFPAGTTEDEIHRVVGLHKLAALGEGTCPQCAGDLKQADGDSKQTPGTGRPWMHCANCSAYWQVDHEAQKVMWEAAWAWLGLDHPFSRDSFGGAW
ncbi:hypothetical protein [Streptosporangium sp. NPDC048865]|uniref:hypothetical protein n=1 Tax=Streptosporangium sp. NPDC048865 TaxID=3155766 RepID=UPI00343CC56A